MERSFLFVDGVQADKSSKRLLRRHVMKGKNAGKTVHRRSRLPKCRPKINDTTADSSRSVRDFERTYLTVSPSFSISPDSLRVINDCEDGNDDPSFRLSC